MIFEFGNRNQTWIFSTFVLGPSAVFQSEAKQQEADAGWLRDSDCKQLRDDPVGGIFPSSGRSEQSLKTRMWLNHYERVVNKTLTTRLIFVCSLPILSGLSTAKRKFADSLNEFKFQCIGDAETDDEICIGEPAWYEIVGSCAVGPVTIYSLYNWVHFRNRKPKCCGYLMFFSVFFFFLNDLQCSFFIPALSTQYNLSQGLECFSYNILKYKLSRV